MKNKKNNLEELQNQVSSILSNTFFIEKKHPVFIEQKISISKELKKINYATKKPTQNNFLSLNYPVFLMNMPLSLNNDIPNNVWVEGKVTGEKAGSINLEKALSEFIDFYSLLSQFAIVYLLPTTGNFQDLYYVANIGVALDPTDSGIPFILSNFRSGPRVNEEIIGRNFLSSMNFACFQPPYFFEGKADCLRIKKGVYASGYGIRTDKQTHKWLMDNFNIKVISIKMTEPALYHLDCNLFVINEENILACTELLDPKDLKELEKETNIIPISIDDAFSGSCNSIQTGNGAIINASLLSSFKENSDDYFNEVKRIDKLGKIFADLGYELILIELKEATKSGALASCCVCPLNYIGLESRI